MKSLLSCLAAVVAISFSGCGTTHYNVQQGNVGSLSGIKTFAWGKKTKEQTAGDFYSNRPVYLELVRKDVESVLIGKGYQRVPARDAQMIVNSTIITHQLDAGQVDVIFETKHNITVAPAASKAYESGTILVSLKNAKTHESLWRGAVTKPVDRSQPYEVQKDRIHKAVIGLLQQVPSAY
jgi:Domain of unknown function (DUF4136)